MIYKAKDKSYHYLLVIAIAYNNTICILLLNLSFHYKIY